MHESMTIDRGECKNCARAIELLLVGGGDQAYTGWFHKDGRRFVESCNGLGEPVAEPRNEQTRL